MWLNDDHLISFSLTYTQPTPNIEFIAVVNIVRLRFRRDIFCARLCLSRIVSACSIKRAVYRSCATKY